MIQSTNFEMNENKYFEFKKFNIIPLNNIKFDCLNILMIDDNKKDIDLTREILSTDCQIKFSLHGYTNVYEGLNDLNNNITKPDLIILDLIMPGMNGKMALDEIKSSLNAKDIPVIICSSMNNYENVMHFNKNDVHAFFEKPLNIEEFEEFILSL